MTGKTGGVSPAIVAGLTMAAIYFATACVKSGGTIPAPRTGGASAPGTGGNLATGGSQGAAGSATGPDAATDATGGSRGGAAGANGSCAGALLCEDFEAYVAGNAPAGPWKVSTTMAMVRVDSTHASSGSRAVRFTTDGGTGTYRRAYISIEGAPLLPVAGNVIFGRMMVWLAAAPAGSVHWTNIQGEGPVPNMAFRAFSRYGGQQQKRLIANYETEGVASDCWQHSATTIPEGRWACFEWTFNGPNNEMNFWLNGTALADITVTGRGAGCVSQGTSGNWYSPTYDTIRLGWEHYQQSVSHDMWIDDVALDTKRIGCPPLPAN